VSLFAGSRRGWRGDPNVFGTEIGCDGSWEDEMRRIGERMTAERWMATIKATMASKWGGDGGEGLNALHLAERAWSHGGHHFVEDVQLIYSGVCVPYTVAVGPFPLSR